MKIESGGKYQVKLVPANCHREEIIFEIVSALDHLSLVTDEIFSCVRKRVSEQCSQVSAITTRVNAAAEQILQLKSSSKAIQILSPAKFPEESELKLTNNFPVLQLNFLGEQKKMTDSDEIMQRVKSQRILYESPVKNTDELLQYYRVKDFNYLKGSNLGKLGMQYYTGIGNPPPELAVVDSFFLCNTAENPYNRYILSEQSGASSSSKIAPRVEITNKVNGKLEANTGDTDKQVQNQDVDDFYYYPSSVQIPTIDVPDYLPDLPGLSDTLNFGPIETTMPSVFSFQRHASIEKSSDVATLIPKTTDPVHKEVTETKSLVVHPTTATAPPPFSSIPPPPPLPPPGFHLSPLTSQSSKNVQNIHQSTSAPPPPRLPAEDILKPTATILDTSQDTPNESSLPKAKAEGGEDLRCSLMAAIREAGGKSKLRSGKDIRTETRKKKQEVTDTGHKNANGGDLMSDLKNSLAMRRRGISGMNDSRKPGLGDIMQKIASSIPDVDDESIERVHGNLSDEDDWD